VLAPGPADQPLRYIDARDLASWLLGAVEGNVSGPVNLVNPPDHATMRTLLEAAVTVTESPATLIWVDPKTIETAGIHRWTELPCWLPPGDEFAGLIWTNVDRARSTGLRCRPVEQTVADTWSWMEEPGCLMPHPPLGLDPAKERAVLAAFHQG
jgi:2'-hydroxyisoflavone reductase